MIETLPRDMEKALAELGLRFPITRPWPRFPRPVPVHFPADLPIGWTPAFKGEDPPF